MRHPFRWATLAVGVLIAGLAIVLAVNVGNDPRADLNTSRLVGKPAPDFALTRLDGTPVTKADLGGKTVIVNFWNSWCVPCRDELPALRRWYDEHRADADVVLLGIPRDDTASAIRGAAEDDGVVWSVAQDDGARAATLAFGTRGQPETFVLGPQGYVVGSVYGPVTVPLLDRMLAAGRGTA
jgi:cytochrome c biogenesis protein CcmG/thiol:disulfide interchange protein DsbE